MKRANILITEESKLDIPKDTVLGNRYRVVKPIGDGAIGKCFLVTDTREHKEKVIKVIKNQELWETLSNNAKVLKKINHKNIVKTQEIKALNGYPCFVQEYISGCSLEALALNESITLGICVQILEDILSALKYMDDLGISHKDIKPSNIIYDFQQNKATLVDLDYAVINGENYRKFLGTIKYSAPEQALQNYTSIKSDCYSLGLVLCYLIIGRLPFNVDLNKRDYIIKQHLERAIKSNQAYPCPALEKLYALISSLVSYDYNKRISIADAVDLILEIKNIISESSIDIVLHDTQTLDHIEPWSVFPATSLIETTVVGIANSIPPFNRFRQADMPAKARDNEKNSVSKEDRNKEQRYDSTYRTKLMAEYDNILLQAKISFGLWVISILVCFAMIIVAMCLIIKGEYAQGIITAVLDAFVLAIQKLFNIREDHYRKMVEQKMKHLEDGDYLEYVFEKAMMFDNPKDRNREAMELLKQIKECTKSN